MRNTEAQTGAQRSAGRAAQFAWVALLGCVALVIAAGFALTFHGLYGFGREVAHWGPALSALGPIADDGLTLVAIAATFLLAHAKAPRRPVVYAWFVFAVSCAASIAGNTAYALRPLPIWVGAIGAALCPIFVTLASHLGVVCWRHCAPSARGVRDGDAGDTATPNPRPVAAPIPPPGTPPAGPTPTPKIPAPPSAGRQDGGGKRRDEARRRYVAGESCASIAKSIEGNPAKRTVEMWTEDLRDSSLPVMSGGVSDQTVVSGVSGGVKASVNGSRPT